MRIPDEGRNFCTLIRPTSTQCYDIFRLFWGDLNSLFCCGFIKADMDISETGEGTQHIPGNSMIES